MITSYDLEQEIKSLAKKHYGDMDLAWLWGCAQALLSVNQLEIIVGILKDKEDK